jgi:hypothetical protein
LRPGWGLELLWGVAGVTPSLGMLLQNPHRRQTIQVPASWLRKGFHSALQPPGECPTPPTPHYHPRTPPFRGPRKGVGCGVESAPHSPLPCSLQSHQRQHNKDKPYKCPNCYRAYSDSASLQIHLSAHAIKHAKAYCCSMCGRAYTSVSLAAWHQVPKPRGRTVGLGFSS